MAKTVVGLFDSYTEASNAVQDLQSAGISQGDISLVANNTTGEYDAHTSGSSTADNAADAASTGAGTGATAGAVIGGGLGLLAGLGSIVIPGFGPIVAAGWIVSTLTGAGIGAATGAAVGGLVGALTGAGVPEEEAGYYSEGVRRGGTLITVRADDNQAQNVADILSRHGAVDIDQRADYYRTTGYTGYNPQAQPYAPDQITAERASYRSMAPTAGLTSGATAATATTNLNTDTTTTARNLNQGEVALPVVEEELQVGKREVQRGGARIHTFMTETPVQEQVNLREEHVTVERHAVNRPVSSADLSTFQEGTIEVTETAEVPVVSKQARVVEEVVVGKEATQRTETVSDTVRRTDVEVEQIPGSVTTGTTGVTGGHVSRDMGLPGNSIPGVQTGGTNADGSPDSRGLTEKVADAVTGDRMDDKTGKRV